MTVSATTRAAIAGLALAAAACAHVPAPASRPMERPAQHGSRGEVGFASFYGKSFQGHHTANGAHYDMHALTCAHRTAPFGTRLRVTDLESGRSVVVTVTDRGPFRRDRVVDLSLAAARALGIVERGLVRVRVERLE